MRLTAILVLFFAKAASLPGGAVQCHTFRSFIEAFNNVKAAGPE
jgi:hypothetical protein